MRDGRPHVMLKLAISADGKAGAAGGQPVAITGDAVRDRVHLLRAENDAIMIGIGTALADDPMLTCRLPGMAKSSPVRIVLDSALRLPLDSRLVQTARETPVWVIAGTECAAAPRSRPCERKASKSCGPTTSEGRLDLAAVLKLLAARGITRLMVEGGPTLAAALIGVRPRRRSHSVPFRQDSGRRGARRVECGGRGGAGAAAEAHERASLSGQTAKTFTSAGDCHVHGYHQ